MAGQTCPDGKRPRFSARLPVLQEIRPARLSSNGANSVNPGTLAAAEIGLFHEKWQFGFLLPRTVTKSDLPLRRYMATSSHLRIPHGDARTDHSDQVSC